jgi:hypothetical protein
VVLGKTSTPPNKAAPSGGGAFLNSASRYERSAMYGRPRNSEPDINQRKYIPKNRAAELTNHINILLVFLAILIITNSILSSLGNHKRQGAGIDIAYSNLISPLNPAFISNFYIQKGT